MDVFLLSLVCLNISLLTAIALFFFYAKNQARLILAKAKRSEIAARVIVKAAHESVTSTAERVILLTRKLEDLKQNFELQKLGRK